MCGQWDTATSSLFQLQKSIFLSFDFTSNLNQISTKLDTFAKFMMTMANSLLNSDNFAL